MLHLARNLVLIQQIDLNCIYKLESRTFFSEGMLVGEIVFALALLLP